MKRILLILTAIIMTCGLKAQQVPLSQNYLMDKYSLSPSYAGNYNPKYMIMGYRSDWTGIDGGPKTVRISYNDVFPFMENAGYGGKIVYDKAGIFSQLYIMGSYSYNLQINQDHHVMFGLSAGVYKNRLNLLDYYNDPKYTIDPSLISQDVKSKLKFMSDFSAVWTYKGAEAGFMFSNISFGDASYKGVDLKYNPLANFQFHGTYQYKINEQWDLNPLAIIRAGKYIKSQFEMAVQVMYLKKVWGSLAYRDPGVIGIGLGANIDKGLKIAYNFNFATNVAMGTFNNHEISIGINIFEYVSKKSVPLLKEDLQ
jgi:type IX secretion system PorP/SprF family membrane protein